LKVYAAIAQSHFPKRCHPEERRSATMDLNYDALTPAKATLPSRRDRSLF